MSPIEAEVHTVPSANSMRSTWYWTLSWKVVWRNQFCTVTRSVPLRWASTRSMPFLLTTMSLGAMPGPKRRMSVMAP
ncbi:hypothetical protein D3C79_857110 [compost metagenome]